MNGDVRKRKVLVFSDYFEPGFKAGGPIRTLRNIFKALEDSCEFFVFTRNYDAGDTNSYNLPEGTWLSIEEYKILYCAEKHITRKNISQQIEIIGPDVLYLNSFFSWRLSIQVILSCRKRRKIILAPRGEFSKGALKFKGLRKGVYLFVSRILNLYQDVTFHASSEIEAKEITSQIPNAKILVAPDIVQKISFREKTYKETQRLSLCFVSRINRKKNLRYCIETLRHFCTSKNKVTFDIYGPIEDEKYWEECCQDISNYKLRDFIRYRGVISPNEVAKTFAQYDFFFFPTFGENFGHVIYESLISGTPVILSDTTFWSAYKNNPNWSYIFDLGKQSELLEILDTCYAMDNYEYRSLSDNAVRVAQAFADPALLKLQTMKLFEATSD